MRPGHVLAGVGVVVLILGLIMKGYDIVCALLTCLYPMIYSIRAIESPNEDDDKQWLSFWTVFGIFQTIELFFGFILSFIPYYAVIRLVFFIFLMHPATNGAHKIYESVFKPLLIKHKKDIEELIAKVKSGAGELSNQAMDSAKKAAQDLNTPENIAKAAAVAAQVQNSQKME